MENKFEKIMSQKTDEELKEILNSSHGDYQQEAKDAAKVEAEKRNLNIESAKERNEKVPEKDMLIQESNNKRYPALSMISMYFKILAWLTLAITIWFIFYSMSHTEIELTAGVISFFSGLVVFVIFLGISELIKIIIDIEHNTRNTAINSSK